MDTAPGTGETLSRILDAAEDASPVEAVEAVTRELGGALGAIAVSFLIADFSGRGLVRFNRPSAAVELSDAEQAMTLLPFDGGPAEEAMRTQTVQVLAPTRSGWERDAGATWTVLAPVTERGDALGLLEMSLPHEPDPQVLEEIGRTAHALGFVVIANRRHTDLFEWGQRSTLFTLPAEIQRRLLPPAFTCEAGSFTLSGWLEPADTIGGDTFDYSVARDILHLTVTDAMGHGIASSLTATLCLGSLRNTRRRGVSLLEQAAAANAALAEHATRCAEETYVTGLLGQVDLRTGMLELVNAGHACPYLDRAGAVRMVDLDADLPLGLFADSTYRISRLELEPGDRLVVVTDGMLERNAASFDIAAAIGRSRALHPREATRQLADLVLAAAGAGLADDATLLILDWHGYHGRGRATVDGADRSRTTAPTVEPD